MPRKALQPPVSRRGVLWLGWKFLIALSTALCFFAILRLHRLYLPGTASASASASLSVARSRIPLHGYSGDHPKIAFLFLARRDLPLDFLWHSFFKDADPGYFSIYIHSTPGFVFNEATSRSHFFYNRQLKNSIKTVTLALLDYNVCIGMPWQHPKVVWGESSMIAAERLLFATALQDPSNQRFVLLSDSCVPLYDFSYVYGYLMGSPRSFVDSFIDTKEKRYSLKMSPVIPKRKWRKGSQWITLIRSHAEVIVNDDIVFPVFEKFCKRAPPLDARKKWLYLKLPKRHNCIPDEHYVQTLLTMRGLESELERRTLTYTVWNLSAAKSEAKSWHPITFTYKTAAPEHIKQMKEINHVSYDSEFRTEWCRVNATSVPCFLFARKFTRGAAMRLLGDGLVRPSTQTIV